MSRLRRGAWEGGGALRMAGNRRAQRGGHVLHQRHNRESEGSGIQPSLDLPPLDGGVGADVRGADRSRSVAGDSLYVPRELVGTAARGMGGGVGPDFSRPLFASRADLPFDSRRAADGLGGRARGSGREGGGRPMRTPPLFLSAA